jgi:hypothetical protein
MRFLEAFLGENTTPEVPTKPTKLKGNPAIPTLEVPTKPSKPGSVGFVGTGTLVSDGKNDPVWSDPNVIAIATYEAGGLIVAALIFAPVLKALVWLAFEDDFKPNDRLAVFYGHELRHLKTKTPETLKKIHEAKLAFWPWVEGAAMI